MKIIGAHIISNTRNSLTASGYSISATERRYSLKSDFFVDYEYEFSFCPRHTSLLEIK